MMSVLAPGTTIGRRADPTWRLLKASEAAVVARQRVRHLTERALCGGAHDSEGLDTAILQQRQAEQASAAALRGWARWRRQQHRTQAHQAMCA